MIITIITNPELGWDCVVGAAEGSIEENMEWLEEEYPEDSQYIYHQEEI